jgi:hypothetical protein
VRAALTHAERRTGGHDTGGEDHSLHKFEIEINPNKVALLYKNARTCVCIAIYISRVIQGAAERGRRQFYYM